MKRFALIMLCIFGLGSMFPGSAAEEPQATSQWLSSPLNIDGETDDWADVTLFKQEKMGIDLCFKNNDDTLFLLFKYNDRKFMSSVTQTGLTIWFNTEGKKKKLFGILFRQQSVPAQNYIAFLERQGQTLSDEKKTELLNQRTIKFYTTYVVDKKGKVIGPPSDGTEYSPAFFRVKMENRLPVYEFAVPLNKAGDALPGVGAASGESVTIGFEWGGMTEEMRKKNLERQAETGGRGGGAGETGFNTSNRGMVPRESSGPKKRSFWVDVRLAVK
jgi:hypothetical protein